MKLFYNFLYIGLLQIGIVLGAASAAAKGNDPVAGAVGATIGEALSEKLQKDLLTATFLEAEAQGLSPEAREDLFIQKIENTEKWGRIAAAGTAWMSSLDITTADAAAKLAIEHNSLPHVIAGGALIGFVAYDYLDTLMNEGWDGLCVQIGDEYTQVQAAGPHWEIAAAAYIALKYESIALKLLSYKWGQACVNKIVKPGSKAFNELVSKIIRQITPQEAIAGAPRNLLETNRLAKLREDLALSRKLQAKAGGKGAGAAAKAIEITGGKEAAAAGKKLTIKSGDRLMDTLEGQNTFCKQMKISGAWTKCSQGGRWVDSYQSKDGKLRFMKSFEKAEIESYKKTGKGWEHIGIVRPSEGFIRTEFAKGIIIKE